MYEVPLRHYIWQATRTCVFGAINRCRGDKRKAAKLLHVSLATIYRVIEQPPPRGYVKPKPPPNECRSIIRSRFRHSWKRPLGVPRLRNCFLYFGVNVSFNRLRDLRATEDRNTLTWMFEDAHRRYLMLMRENHPDTHPDANGKIYEINQMWSLLKRYLKKVGVGER